MLIFLYVNISIKIIYYYVITEYYTIPFKLHVVCSESADKIELIVFLETFKILVHQNESCNEALYNERLLYMNTFYAQFTEKYFHLPYNTF